MWRRVWLGRFENAAVLDEGKMLCKLCVYSNGQNEAAFGSNVAMPKLV